MSTLVAQFGESNALHAERDGELAAVMEIVGDDVPDNPLARERVVFPLVGKLVSLREIGDILG